MWRTFKRCNVFAVGFVNLNEVVVGLGQDLYPMVYKTFYIKQDRIVFHS